MPHSILLLKNTIRQCKRNHFIAGGDQANYINFWMGTPVQTAMNDAIRRSVPIGGTSAGLAVMGEYLYTAQGDKPDESQPRWKDRALRLIQFEEYPSLAVDSWKSRS